MPVEGSSVIDLHLAVQISDDRLVAPSWIGAVGFIHGSSRHTAGGLGELSPEYRQPLIKSRLHRAQWTTNHISNFLKCEAVVFLQDDRSPLLFGQPRHHAFDERRKVFAGNEFLDGLRRL